MNKKNKLTALERGWILYDVGNSAFSMMISTLIPIFFNALAESAGVHEDLYLSYWGYAGSIATILVAIIGPVCGAIADRNNKKSIFLISMLVGVAACALLGAMSGWLAFLAMFILSKVGFSASIVFYDSMLTEITTDKRMDKISSLGYAYGYIGSVIPFIVCLVLVLMHDSFGLTQSTAMAIAFLLISAWWLGCSMPLLKGYKQTAFRESTGTPVKDAFRQIVNNVAADNRIGLNAERVDAAHIRKLRPA
mgnify:CR=1 FL=1